MPYLPAATRSRLSLAVRHALFTGLLAGAPLLMTAPLAQAADAASEQSRSYAIPAGPLDQALNRFASKAGILLAVDAQLTAGKRSPGLNGSHTVDDGLVRLLQGSGLRALNAGGSYVLEKAVDSGAAVELGTTNINANGLGATTEGTGSYTTGSTSAATKMNLSPRETPQSVSVITRQRIEDQNINTLGEAIKYAPGVTLSKWGGERERFNSRGFQINNLMIDGLPMEYEEAALSTGLLSMYDRVEVVRGASGLMEGAGTPGGSINLVRKRPTKEFQGSATASAGSWDNYRNELDLSGPLNDSATLRGRTVLAYQDKNSFIDDYENQRSLFYGILEGDLSEDTTLTLGASWSKDNNPGADWNGLGTYPDGSFLPISRSTRMSPSWSYWDKESTTVFAELEHRFANDWKARIAASLVESEMDMLGTFLNSSTLDANGDPSFTMRGGAYNYDRDQKSIDGYLSGPFQLLGRSHELVLGTSYRRSEHHDTGAATTDNGSFDIATINPLAWDPDSLAIPEIGAFGTWHRYQQTDQTGVYGASRFSLTDQLSLIVGSRLDWYEMDTIQYDAGWPYGEANYKTTREFTPYAGLVYDLNDTYSLYASWTRIFTPQNYATASGGLLDPQEGSNYELGIKGEYFDGRLNASLAIFQIDLENLPQQLPTASCQAGLAACYESAGEVRSRGFELELTGELTPSWQVAASYTYNHAIVRESAADGANPIGTGIEGKRYGTNLPLNLAKLSTSYRLPGVLNQWRVGGSVYSQSDIFTPQGVEQGGYTLFDLEAGYDVNSQLALTLNAKNIFDKRYYTSISEPIGSNFFGEPRSYNLTARYKF
ncbi:TonB-dependent siderophore receptor [Pseudomonas subflava]|uniref:TonB-dependent siderophore receptor n=1 Tax=Pseudomonas subflava TaxID=2952933 RepID=UPI0020799115|nr:TonB-dependent siderophore receptor [Pseudomonas subflava]